MLAQDIERCLTLLDAWFDKTIISIDKNVLCQRCHLKDKEYYQDANHKMILSEVDTLWGC